MEQKANKQQQTHGVKSNRLAPKEDFVFKHKRSKVKSVEDPRMALIQIRLVHPSKSVMTKTIESYRLDAEIRTWTAQGYEVNVNN
jgi:hypothetical protein